MINLLILNLQTLSRFNLPLTIVLTTFRWETLHVVLIQKAALPMI